MKTKKKKGKKKKKFGEKRRKVKVALGSSKL